MPLIIHPESSCDVCLENLTYDDPTPPYAIPCGHIFCKECLRRTDPHNCPLCRKPYLPERAKKLITGERTAAAGPSEDDNLLRRLVVSWDMQEEQLATLLTEVDTWLSGRTGDTSLPLRKAREALSSHQRLTTQTHENERTIRHLKHRLRRHNEAALLDKNTAVAIEQSLRAQLEEDLNTKLSQYETEIENLRKEISVFRYTKNPLPPPPEPFPLDRLPPFAQPSGPGSNIYRWPFPPAESSSTTYPQNGNGYINPYDAASVRPHTPVDEAAPRNHHRPSREPDGSRSKDRKGKQRAKEDKDRRHDTHRSPGAPPRGLPINEAETTGANTSFNGNRNAIIPGATPNRRVVPNSVFDKQDLDLYTGYESPVDPRDMRPVGLDLHFDNSMAGPIDPFTLTAGILQEYANGFGSGFQDATNLQASQTHSSAGPANGAAQSSLLGLREGRNEQSSMRQSPTWVVDPPVALRPAHNPTHSGLTSRGVPTDEPTRVLPQWAQPQAGARPAQYGTAPPSAPAPPVSVAYMGRPGVSQEEPSIPPPPFQTLPQAPFTSYGYDSDSRQRERAVPESLRPRTNRRATVQLDGNLTDVTEYSSRRIFDASTVRAPSLHRRPAARPSVTLGHVPTTGPTVRPEAETRSIASTARDSTASWGTVESNGAPSVTRTVRSITDLPLTTFEDGAGVRGSIHSESSIISFSRGNPFQNHSSAEREDVDRSHDSTTPRNRPASFSESVSTVRPDSGITQPTERSRDRRMVSFPASPSHAQGSRYTQATTLSSGQPPDPTHAPTHRSRRSGRHHHPTTSTISPVPVEDVTQRSRPGTTADPTWSDTGYFTDAPLSTSDNALGLQISHIPQITAPTPMVSSRTFLRSFSHDYS